MSKYPIRKSLPASHTRELGRVMHRWANLEWLLRETARQLLRTGPKETRLVIGTLSAGRCRDLLQDLMAIRDIKVKTDLKQLKNTLDRLQIHRNHLAHGVWVSWPKDPRPVLQLLTEGPWQPDPGKPPPKRKGRKRKIDPEGIPLAAKDLRALTEQIDKALDTCLQLDGEVLDAVKASKELSNKPPH